jgi:hypothetical protein
MILPPEILTQISKYLEEDYKTLCSCVLVNKQWHIINIPILWSNLFHSKNSIKILINCILMEDKDFFKNNNIEQEKLEKSPLHNYAKFASKLNFGDMDRKLNDFFYNKTIIEKHKLVNYILNYSIIKTLEINNNDYSEFECLINHPRFNTCFQNLNELVCYYDYDTRLFDNLKVACKDIQVLKAFYPSCYRYESLVQLIKSQTQIKEWSVNSWSSAVLSTNLTKALLNHSKSIQYMEG